MSATAILTYAKPHCELRTCGKEIDRRPDERLHIYVRRRFCCREHFEQWGAGEQTNKPLNLPPPADLGREAELYGDLRYDGENALPVPKVYPAPALLAC